METNFCRQITKEYSELTGIPEKFHGEIERILSLSSKAVKFQLPINGKLYDNLEFKALEDLPEIRLPFPVIALEFFLNEDPPAPDKAVVLAREDGNRIAVTPVVYYKKSNAWGCSPEILIPRVGSLDRLDGEVGINFEMTDESQDFANYNHSLLVLMQFLDILSCSNVHIEQSRAKPPMKKKGALPFDIYHVLIIGDQKTGSGSSTTDHRSPREHIRRGHIRRYSDGKKIWINAMVVAKGSPGKVTKDYRLKI